MLVARVNPPAKKVFQTSPFSQVEVEGDLMIAKCSSLVVGAMFGTQNDEITFQVRFGKIKYEKNPDGTNGNPIFDIVVVTRVNFTSQEMADWGTDDSIVYDKIAEKLGFDVISTEVMNIRFTA
jgi:hypothetical protein